MHLYRDMIGIPLKVDPAFAKDKALSKTLGVSNPGYRHAVGNIPGTTFQVDFLEFKGIDRKLGHTQPFDIGSSNLRMRVTDAIVFVKHLQEGVKVASAGGEPILLNNNVITCILSDPNDFFFQIMSAAPHPTAAAPAMHELRQ